MISGPFKPIAMRQKRRRLAANLNAGSTLLGNGLWNTERKGIASQSPAILATMNGNIRHAY